MNLRINIAPLLTCVTYTMVVRPGTDLTHLLETWISNYITGAYGLPCIASCTLGYGTLPEPIKADYAQMRMELDRALPASAMIKLIRKCETCIVTIQGNILLVSCLPPDHISSI